MKSKIAVLLVFVVLSILYTWPLVLHLPNAVTNSGDPLFYAWNLSHNLSSFSSGIDKIMNTNIFYPTTNTLAFSDTLFTQSLLTFPLLLLTGNPILIQNIYIIFSFILAGIGVYILALELNVSAIGALVSAILFAFSYPRLGQLSHISIASSFLLPFFFLHMIKFFSKATILNAVLCVLTFLLLLGSTIYLGIIAGFGAVIFIGVMLIQNKNYRNVLWSKKILLTISLIATLIMSLVILYPYIILRVEHPEIQRTYDEISSRGAYQKDFSSVLPTSLILSRILPSGEGERSLYPTLAALILALFGLYTYTRTKNQLLLAFLIVGASGFLLSFGPARPFTFGPFDTGYISLPYAFFLKILPILYIIRVPSRFIILFTLALSVFAGMGFDFYKKKSLLLVSLLVLLFFVETIQKPLPLIPVPTETEIPAVYASIKNDPSVRTIIELPIIEERDRVGQLPIQEQVKLRFDEVSIHTPLALETYRTYFSLFHKKQMINGYSGFVPQSFHDAVEEMRYFPEERAISYLKRKKVSHVIIHFWQYSKDQKNSLIQKLSSLNPSPLYNDYGEDRIYTVSSL